MNTDVMTTKQIAEQFNVQTQTVSRWCQRGKLPGAYKIGRDWIIPNNAIESFKRPDFGRPTNGKVTKSQ